MDKHPDYSEAGNKAAGTRHMLIVVGVLLLFAAAATGSRLLMQKIGEYPAGDGAWSVILLASADAPDAGALVRVAPPWDTRHARLYGQSLLHPGMRQRRAKADQHNRDIVLLSTRAGEFKIKAQLDIHISQVPRPEPKRPQLKENDRAAWLAPAEGIPLETAGVASLLDKLTGDMPETSVLVERLFNHTSEQIRVAPKGSDDGGAAFKKRKASALGITRAMVMLLRDAHLPARVVSGLDLSATDEKQPRYWAEVYYDSRWHPVDAAGGHYNELPAVMVPLRKGSEQILETENARVTEIRWHIQQVVTPRGLSTTDEAHILTSLDLTRLSPTTRQVLSLLLLLPLGALSTEALRQLVGIRTYGTFTPTLLALAAVYVDMKTAAIVFALVTVVGVAGRAMMPDLQLTRVPRLSIVFTLIAMVMALVVSLLIYLDPSVDSAVVLLPIVILTMLVDRIYSIADEKGMRIAMYRLGWTVIAALFSLAILLQAHWGEWLLRFPEVHAITVASIILLGSYRGKTLTDLQGLGWLREPLVKRSRRRIAGSATAASPSQDSPAQAALADELPPDATER